MYSVYKKLATENVRLLKEIYTNAKIMIYTPLESSYKKSFD